MKDNEKTTFIGDEKKLLIKYLDEYNEMYEKIFLLSEKEFISNIKKRVELTLKEKINFYSLVSINKIEKYFKETYYLPDLKLASIAKKHIINQSIKEKNQNYFDEEIIPHCENDKKDNYYIHSCGEKFYFFKYKVSTNNNYFLHKVYDYILYCIKCDNIYKSSMIKLKCFNSDTIFYSKLLNNNDLNKEPCYATWKKYHCNAIINDIMKCQNCNNNLLYNKNTNTLICLNCNVEFNPSDIKFTCLICKKQFVSEAKIYNPLEYKLLKISIKDALIKKENAFPKYMGCKCDINVERTLFFHKNSCKGILYLGEMNVEKIIVCSECNSIGAYDEFIWTCPKCLKRFQIKKHFINNDNDNYYDNNFLSLTDSWNIDNKLKKRRMHFFKSKNNKEYNKNINNRNNSQKKINFIRNSEIKPKIKININNDEFDDTNSINSSRIKVKKRLFTYKKNKDDMMERNSSINNSSKISKVKDNYEKYRKNIKDNMVSLYKKKNLICKRGKNSLTKFNSRDNSIKNHRKTNIENTLLNKDFDTSQSLNYRSDFNNYFYNLNNNNDINKDIFRGKILNENNIRVSSLNTSIEKYHNDKRPNKITSYIKIKNKFKKNKNNIGIIDKEKIEIPKHKKDFFVNKIKNKSSNYLNFYGILKQSDNLNKSTQIRNMKEDYILSPKEFTKINILKNDSNISNNIYNNKNNNSKNETDKKNQKNIIIRENVININKCSDSTAYESEQNSKFNSIKLGQLFYNNNNNNQINDTSEYNNISKYKIIKQIGRGTFGQIFMVENENKEFFALKKLIACSLQEIRILEQEYQLLFDLNSAEANIDLVKIYKIEKKQLDPTTFVMYVLMELSYTDWEKEILNRKKELNYYKEKELIDIMSSLIKTFAYLQKKNISHRDIKPQNILVFKDNKYKLADFGEAKELIDESKITEGRTLRGTELYMSPILFNALRSRKIKKYIKHNTYKSDVFSFGLCILFAATLCFESLYEIRELNNNEDVNYIVENYLNTRYSKQLITFINSMLDLNESTRSDFIDLEQKFNCFKNNNILL